MIIWLLSCALGNPVAVVGIGNADADTIARVRVAEPDAMTTSTMWRVLSGSDDPRTPAADSLEQMLRDARDREARYDTAGANELRAEIGHAFAHSTRPTRAIVDVAARALHDTAAALLADGDRAAALRAAATALRSFPDTPLDVTRHPPAVVALFDRARAAVDREPRGRLRVEVDAPGAVMVDGFRLGPIDDVVERDLPVGNYRVWWIGDAASSLPHAVELSAAGATVAIAAQLEAAVRLRPAVTVDCAESCGEPLRAIGQRLGVTRIIGVREGAPGLSVDIATGESMPWPAAHIVAETPSARARFSPWYLVPFGVGQFAQDRPIFGGAYAAGQLGLLIWHLVTWQQHANAVDNNDFNREPDLRAQRNRSAAFFYGILAANIAEALIVGWVTGE